MNFVKFLLTQYFFDILFFNVLWIVVWTPIKNTFFWNTMMRSFRWIEINSFNRFRFIVEVSTNSQKMHYFGQFKDCNQEGKKEIKQMTPFFHVLFEFCLWYSFLYLKNVKIHFHGFLLLFILVCKMSEFWRCKLWDQKFSSFCSGNIHIMESIKTVLLYLSSWKPNLLDLLVYFCLF